MRYLFYMIRLLYFIYENGKLYLLSVREGFNRLGHFNYHIIESLDVIHHLFPLNGIVPLTSFLTSLQCYVYSLYVILDKQIMV